MLEHASSSSSSKVLNHTTHFQTNTSIISNEPNHSMDSDESQQLNVNLNERFDEMANNQSNAETSLNQHLSACNIYSSSSSSSSSSSTTPSSSSTSSDETTTNDDIESTPLLHPTETTLQASSQIASGSLIELSSSSSSNSFISNNSDSEATAAVSASESSSLSTCTKFAQKKPTPCSSSKSHLSKSLERIKQNKADSSLEASHTLPTLIKQASSSVSQVTSSNKRTALYLKRAQFLHDNARAACLEQKCKNRSRSETDIANGLCMSHLRSSTKSLDEANLLNFKFKKGERTSLELNEQAFLRNIKLGEFIGSVNFLGSRGKESIVKTREYRHACIPLIYVANKMPQNYSIFGSLIMFLQNLRIEFIFLNAVFFQKCAIFFKEKLFLQC